MFVTGNGNVEELNVESKQSAEICLTEKEIFDLVEVGQIVQAYSGAARDIEWAISNDGKVKLPHCLCCWHLVPDNLYE